MNIVEENWEEIIQKLKIEHSLTDVSFKTWILPLRVYKVTSNTVYILVNLKASIDYIKNKYLLPFQVCIAEVVGKEYEVKFIAENEFDPKDFEDKTATPKSKVTVSQAANLNPKYTFDTFVVGGNNNFAHAASLAVAESPGEVYNPLFLYGGVGLGKTHLMHSIAHFILENEPEKKVLYVTSETFTNELIEAIKNGKTGNESAMTAFREKYRSIDVLLIDDIQFIIGKESTQEEFFHTFNALYEAKKQIIISSDRPPREIETLEDRLRSRFEWGLTVDIQPPDYETRMAILRKKEELEGYNIDNEIIKYIATNVKSNIRELEGALTKIVASSKLNNKEINLELAEEALKDLISPNAAREVTPQLIINVVSEHFGITPLDLIGQKRSKELVFPRQIVMYLCGDMTSESLQNIGKALGGRDHTTIIHGTKKIASELKTDENLKNTIDILKKKINPQ